MTRCILLWGSDSFHCLVPKGKQAETVAALVEHADVMSMRLPVELLRPENHLPRQGYTIESNQ